MSTKAAQREQTHGHDKGDPAVNETARLNAQQDLISEVQYVLEAVLRDKKITRRQLAVRLKKSEATISRALDGDSNLTLKTIADIATALGDRFHVSSKHFQEMKKQAKVSGMYGDEEPSYSVEPVTHAWGPDIAMAIFHGGPVNARVISKAMYIAAKAHISAEGIKGPKGYAIAMGEHARWISGHIEPFAVSCTKGSAFVDVGATPISSLSEARHSAAAVMSDRFIAGKSVEVAEVE